MMEQTTNATTPPAHRPDFMAAQAAAGLHRRQDDVAHWRRVALAASEQGETLHALRCWQRVQRLQPQARDAEFHIACCQAMSGQREQAAETFAQLAADASVDRALRQRAVRLAGLLGYGAL